MTDYELIKLRAQLSVLKDIVKDYPIRTIENVIQNMEARIKGEEKRREDGFRPNSVGMEEQPKEKTKKIGKHYERGC